MMKSSNQFLNEKIEYLFNFLKVDYQKEIIRGLKELILKFIRGQVLHSFNVAGQMQYQSQLHKFYKFSYAENNNFNNESDKSIKSVNKFYELIISGKRKGFIQVQNNVFLFNSYVNDQKSLRLQSVIRNHKNDQQNNKRLGFECLLEIEWVYIQDWIQLRVLIK
ncbi:unnamed protein product [Paramecium sonneborni]|uniref:Uncharacterized protein n=1 Tax=Paramecium sonneborni TaxID=65129 RepID=A0A8S1MF34_9CILI|nr:unnamed protein product [Paramecium sonneborni]